MPKPLVILGAGGNAYDLLDTIEAINASSATWEIVGILDDRRERGTSYLGVPVLGSLADAARLEDCSFVSSIWNEGVSRTLHEVLGRTELTGDRFPVVLHPTASVSSRARLNDGVLVHHAASVAGNVMIGNHVSIGPGCIIGHDTTIDGFTAIAAGAVVSGGVRIGSNCYIGSGSVIRQHIEIGNGAVVGMGAVVVKNVAPNSTVVGNPARPMSHAAQITV